VRRMTRYSRVKSESRGESVQSKGLYFHYPLAISMMPNPLSSIHYKSANKANDQNDAILVSLVSSASDVLQMRVESTKLVVEPGAGRTGKLARVAYHQFNTATWGSSLISIPQHAYCLSLIGWAESYACLMLR
jgi:hypothetical protein